MQQPRSGNHGQGWVLCQPSGGWYAHVQAHDCHPHHDHVLYDHVLHDHDCVHYDPVHYVCRVGILDFLALNECDCVLSQWPALPHRTGRWEQSSSGKGNEEVKL